MATETLSRERVLEIIEECGGDKEHLLSILIEIQRECRRNYINEASARVVAEKLDIPLVQLYDILTFLCDAGDQAAWTIHHRGVQQRSVLYFQIACHGKIFAQRTGYQLW